MLDKVDQEKFDEFDEKAIHIIQSVINEYNDIENNIPTLKIHLSESEIEEFFKRIHPAWIEKYKQGVNEDATSQREGSEE